MTTEIDNDKRRTLKILAGASATGLLTATPLTATAGFSVGVGAGDIINCTLISRADISRVHLLMHNKTLTDVAVISFGDQIIRYDNTTLCLKEAYGKAQRIRTNDRVMVRLRAGALVDSELSTRITDSDVVDMRAHTSYLPQGTRVVKMVAFVKNGIATISNPSALA